jgi:EmrB/QacA subfamily drug resistance transporter
MAFMDETMEQRQTGTGTARRKPPGWAVPVTVCAGQFLVVLDVSVVNVGLPSIRSDLALGENRLQWVVNAYALTFAGFLLLGGKVGDLFGRKRVFLLGLALFALASLAGGLAEDPWLLVAARAAQGTGAAVLAPTTLTILTTSFPEGPARTRAIATWTAVGAGGGAAGALVGGALTEYLSWRWTLLVNVPIGLAVIVAAAVWLPESRRPGVARRLDLPGAVLVTAGMTALAYGIAQTESFGWISPHSLIPLFGGLAVLGLFLLLQARTAEPLIPLGLLRIRSVTSANAVLVAAGAASFAMWYFLTLYMQNVLNYSPVITGLSFIPHTIAIIVGSKLAPSLMALTSPRTVALCGGALGTAGFLWQSRLHEHGTYLGTVLGPGICMTLGAGLMMTPIATAALTGVAARDQGLVSGLLNTSRQLGGALGLTVLATVAAAHITSGGPGALAHGYSAAFRFAAGIILLGTLLVTLLPDPRPART